MEKKIKFYTYLFNFIKTKPLSFKQRQQLVKQSGILDETWYLYHYRDVDIDAALHFAIHGLNEGRIADAKHLDLWTGIIDPSLIHDLREQVFSKNPVVMPYAAWLLGRWFASRELWKEALEVVSVLVSKQGLKKVSTPVFLLWIDALRLTGKLKKAQKVLFKRLTYEYSVDLRLSQANLINESAINVEVKTEKWFESINGIFDYHQLASISLLDSLNKLSIDNLKCITSSNVVDKQKDLISVVVPCFNAASIIKTTIRSLQNQSWKFLEIIVVDDASTDDTVDVIRVMAVDDERIKLVTLEENSGAYFCRNYGVSLATGEFITVHDADDWSHCQKLELQVMALEQDASYMASFSSWVRVSSDMEFGSWQTPSGWNGWVHRNTSSLMVRKQVIEDIGFWDNVICNADTEYHQRILMYYGNDSIIQVLPSVPLSFGRFHAQSLTQLGPTNIFTIFSGLRKDYTEAYMNWHQTIESKSDLYMPLNAGKREFEVPAAMLR